MKGRSSLVPALKNASKGITEAKLKGALRKNAGVYALAARDLGCDRSNVRKRVEKSPGLQTFLAELDAEIADVVDGHIKQALIKGDLKTIRWYAPLKMRDRGYNPRLELTGADGGELKASVNVTVSYVDAKPTEEDER